VTVDEMMKNSRAASDGRPFCLAVGFLHMADNLDNVSHSVCAPAGQSTRLAGGGLHVLSKKFVKNLIFIKSAVQIPFLSMK
jgi:hypothetical protein